MSKYIRT
jgi:hypothetical protein